MKLNTEIKEAIEQDNLVLFAGAGLSSKFNLPSWKKLIIDIINEIDNDSFKNFIELLNDDLMTPIEVLDKLKSQHGLIRKYLAQNFKIEEGDFTLHKSILDLTKQIVTTNFDNAFEKASDLSINPTIYTSDYNVSQINKNTKEYIFKIHGCFTEPDKCILFKEDYDNIYSKQTASVEKIKTFFSEKTMIFIGFGFNDHEINIIFESLDKAYSNFNKHYMLTKNPKDFEKYKFLETIEISDYSEIDSFISECLKFKSNSNYKSTQKEDDRIKKETIDSVSIILKEKLENALSMYNGNNSCWIEPILSSTNEISSNYIENYSAKIEIKTLLSEPNSTIIKSPPQFGLTCLSHHLILKAWEQEKVWIYIDAIDLREIKVENYIKSQLKKVYQTDDISSIECIIIDSWKTTNKGAKKQLKSVANTFNEVPIILMQTIDENEFLHEPISVSTDREFQIMHLLALPKTEMRKIVSSYNDISYIAEESSVLNKIVKDIDTLNMHRTPLNILTLLKVCEKYFDESTVNRSDMISKVLFILFDLKELPTYKSKPDLKDCEFVLGFFCENILRNEKYEFSRSEFINFSNEICENCHLEVDNTTLFDILYDNGIFIEKSIGFSFRSTYWMFYFAAHRMHANDDFCDYIFNSEKYINYPEIIEFYTGIDRRRTNALEILNEDLIKTFTEVNDKLGLPDIIDLYGKVKWNPTEESIENARNELSSDVQLSNLPNEIKDQHSDVGKNQLKAYDQGIKKILHEYSLAVLMRKITASARALRNSDYAKPIVKEQLLNSIVSSWEQITKSLYVLTPELAIKGQAAIGGQGFNLDGDFGNTPKERMNKIVQEIPYNVVKFFKEDIDSNKLGPLLINKIKNEKNDLTKYTLILLLVQIRPKNWRKTIEYYIESIPKDSFYLYDLTGKLRHLYFYDYSIDSEIEQFRFLIKLCYSKHEFGSKKNYKSKSYLNKISNHVLKRPEIDEE